MPKQLVKKQLRAYLNDRLAKTQQVDHEDIVFQSVDAYFRVSRSNLPDIITVTTPKSIFSLVKHESQNYYHTVYNGVKIQVSLKKQVGEIRYWA